MELWLFALLRAAWIAGTLPILVASLPFSPLRSFHDALLGVAKRGKIRQSQSNRWTVPQRFFLHFYMVAVVWTTVLLAATWSYAYRTAPLVSEPLRFSTIASYLTGGSHIFSMHKSRPTPAEHRYKVWQSVFLLLLMEVHVLRRLIETIYVFDYSPSARMHLLGYLTGLYFYVAAPLSLCNCAPEVFKFGLGIVAELAIRSNNQMPSSEFDWWGSLNPLLNLGRSQWIGAATFFWGWIHQRRCHAILGSLRENTEQANEYLIPHGDWFEIVSSPHYLAEIVIYAGFVVASGFADLTVWLLFGFVVTNLVFAAAETQRWYIHKFDNYPLSRRAIIPFVY